MNNEFLEFKVRGKQSPQGKVKVLFSCHPDDFDQTFDILTEKIFQYVDCAFYYSRYSYDDIKDHKAEYESQLSDIRLLVIPVTSRLLTAPGKTGDIDLPFALRNCIPVLPILQEPVSEKSYANVFGSIQYLYELNCDATTLSFEEKLERYLHAVLITDELLQQIRNAFEGQIFLSYRKSDRLYAQKMMRMIHSFEFTRDLSIWYDENITLGEKFDEEILNAIVHSQLFALCVTQNTVRKPNYVIDKELPKARELEQPVLAIEMQKTDQTQLELTEKESFISQDELQKKNLEVEFSRHFEALKKKPRNNTPEHLYLMGLAYLNGIGVENNIEMALELLQKSSAHGYRPAARRLINMYIYGEGVPIDHAKAMDLYARLMYELNELAEAQDNIVIYRELSDVILEALQFMEKYNLTDSEWVHTLTLLGMRTCQKCHPDEYSVFMLYSMLALLSQDEEDTFYGLLDTVNHLLEKNEPTFIKNDECLAGVAYIYSRLAHAFTDMHTGTLTYRLGDRNDFHKKYADLRNTYLNKAISTMKFLYEKDPVKWSGTYAETLLTIGENGYDLDLNSRQCCQIMEEVLSIYRKFYDSGKRYYQDQLMRTCLSYAYLLRLDLDELWDPDTLSVLSDYEETLFPNLPVSGIPDSAVITSDDGLPFDIRRIKKAAALHRYYMQLVENSKDQDSPDHLTSLLNGYKAVTEFLKYIYIQLDKHEYSSVCTALGKEYAQYFSEFLKTVLLLSDFGQKTDRTAELSSVESELPEPPDADASEQELEKYALNLEQLAWSKDSLIEGYDFAESLLADGQKEEASKILAGMFQLFDRTKGGAYPILSLEVILTYSSLVESPGQSAEILLKYIDYFDIQNVKIRYDLCEDMSKLLEEYYSKVRNITDDYHVFVQCDHYLQWAEASFSTTIEHQKNGWYKNWPKESYADILYDLYYLFYLRADCKKHLHNIKAAGAYYEKAVGYAMENVDSEPDECCFIVNEYIQFLQQENRLEEAEYWNEMLDIIHEMN